MPDDDVSTAFYVPDTLGDGASNTVYAGPDGVSVQREPRFGIDALDLRLLNDEQVRRELYARQPPQHPFVAPPSHRRSGVQLSGARLRRHPPRLLLEEHADRLHAVMARPLGRLSKHSEQAAEALLPHAQAAVHAWTSLPELLNPLQCHPDAGDCAVYRAFTLRVAQEVCRQVGADVVAEFGLPLPGELDGMLPPAPRDTSRLCVLHGDPTRNNVMWETAALAQQRGEGKPQPLLIDFDLARVVPEVSAAAATLAAFVTRASPPPSPQRVGRFAQALAGGQEAVQSGLFLTYYRYEVARSAYVDLTRGLRGEVTPELVHSHTRRFVGQPFVGRDAPEPGRVAQLVNAHRDPDLIIPTLPENLHPLVSTPRHPDTVNPVLQPGAVAALHQYLDPRQRDHLPPGMWEQYLTVMDLTARDNDGSSLLDLARQLEREGKTELVAKRLPNGTEYRFRSPTEKQRPTHRPRQQSPRPASRRDHVERGREPGPG